MGGFVQPVERIGFRTRCAGAWDDFSRYHTYIDGRGLATLGIAGEIDRDTAGQVMPAVVKILDSDSVSTVQVDFSGVTFLDSAGIRSLLTAQWIAGERGVTLYVTAAHDYVLEVLKIMGLVDILLGPPTEESASHRGG